MGCDVDCSLVARFRERERRGAVGNARVRAGSSLNPTSFPRLVNRVERRPTFFHRLLALQHVDQKIVIEQ